MTTQTHHASAPETAQGSRVFPPDFVWGAATAAYQIEGAVAVGDDRDARRAGRRVYLHLFDLVTCPRELTVE